MFKLISQVFSDKSEQVDHIEDTGVNRMVRMNAARRLTDTVDDGDRECDDKKDFLSRARDSEVGGGRSYTSRGKEEHNRRMGSLVKDWHRRMAHLPGFKVDPEY